MDNYNVYRYILAQKPGGWLEKYEWGDEDIDLSRYFKHHITRHNVPGFYHQWHPHDISGWKDVIDGYNQWTAVV